MLLKLDFSLDIPIYMQIRNQIVLGIANGDLKPGEKLPPIRTLASETGINTMTVNKAYQVLKQEGYLITDRRSGAMVNPNRTIGQLPSLKTHPELRLLLSEFYTNGINKEELLKACEAIYNELEKGE
ncbi:MAG: GntR family transcriptional regulator [Lachnospiraceae bacterium]|nr:GntR family transcriptional regulator [Lachnospiraceae bacterium]